mgnify:CR=1 FL=1
MIIEFYRGLKRPGGKGLPIPGDWYWRLKAKNGKTIADGSESYSNRGNVKRACGKVAKLMRPGAVTIVEAEA